MGLCTGSNKRPKVFLQALRSLCKQIVIVSDRPYTGYVAT